MLSAFGNLLEKYREAKQLTMEDQGRMLGRSSDTIRSISRKGYRVPAKMLEQLSIGMSLTPKETLELGMAACLDFRHVQLDVKSSLSGKKQVAYLFSLYLKRMSDEEADKELSRLGRLVLGCDDHPYIKVSS